MNGLTRKKRLNRLPASATLSFALLSFLAFMPAFAAPTSTFSPAGRQPATERIQALSKTALLEGLKSIQRKHLQDIETIDQSIRKIMQETQNISLRGTEDVTAGKQIQNLPVRLGHLQSQRDELLLRRDFMDQLIFQVDSKYSGQGAAIFLEQTLMDMAINELTASSPSKSELWRFYTYFSIAIREILEPRDDLLAFLAGYIEFSTVGSPKSPLAYLDSRHYTNGAINQSARPVRREDVGSIVEKHLKAVGTISGATQPMEPAKADILLKTRLSTSKPVNTQKVPDRAGHLNKSENKK